ncbi:NifU family protein [Aquirufa ecclesiirivi]|uniref:NifU family protein n=1 Tax=Aquirufa ecclesiirivi TaxID=2715124 RepID=A0ABT4JJL8_9BACT|nr:NifU family protein [Aquirufa ecclesiirivi]MCZ2471512.1 NifU family protein [Aquirufa ecclesiirivi]MCZ2475766.1 NifU family protein [Aquirufa ecclesiirivi]MDF0693225.1 NifU family protein [Aquirufa ecclesiirivi]NHC49166.1 NifU family protein [Aquirufa ecclesiirivi]
MENHPLYSKVQAALDSIRPYLIADGGNVEIIEITEDNRLKLNLLGACKSCNMSAMTFKAGVEEAIRREVPEIISVEELSQTVQS